MFWKAAPGVETYVTVGTLDRPTGLRLGEHIYVGSKSDFYDLTDGPALGIRVVGPESPIRRTRIRTTPESVKEKLHDIGRGNYRWSRTGAERLACTSSRQGGISRGPGCPQRRQAEYAGRRDRSVGGRRYRHDVLFAAT
ncbi:hypothetical protein BQ8482_111241 [Mesorhizobium delmotii]|uniref:Uncharacterized protein n=1 Tax=Mesorhizobium delmotii TaxID=1631247 RepID=A0A2P9ADW5_9HYPH|nr:hypothetical protein BQ8482_111241 [Mesorhizobium delmotii]